jgi:hypothetical protein
MQIVYIGLGLIAGIASGFLGIGGGAILVPALIYFFGLSQHQAQGTTLAIMVPPIGLLAAIKYYTQGNVNLSLAAFICAGFFFGGLIGAEFAHKIPALFMRRIFGFFLLIVAVKMIISR